MKPIGLEPSWLSELEDQFSLDYMKSLKAFLQDEKQKSIPIFPDGPNIFAALNQTPFDKVQVVILGQDPYHGEGQAHGLSFSVPEGVTVPPSLQNIYKEIARDFGFSIPRNGNLTRWACQGVLLLNATLTVRANQAGSHQNKGWEIFTDRIIQILNDKKNHVVFMLWGSYAQKKGSFIHSERHLVLKAPHPSPLSAHRGFIGCGHFGLCNKYLQENNLIPIDWR
jgi:uracil-DNA glycosylase